MKKAVIVSRYGMGMGEDDLALVLLCKLEELGAEVLLCGTCPDHFGLTDQVSVGQNACVGDVRESMAMDQVDYL